MQDDVSTRWPHRIVCGDEWASDEGLRHYQALLRGLPDMSSLLRRNDGSEADGGLQLQPLCEHGVLEKFHLSGRVRSPHHSLHRASMR